MSNKNICVIVPFYNEEEVIAKVLSELIDKDYKDMDKIADERLKALQATFGSNWSGMITALSGNMSDLKNIINTTSLN